MNYAELNRRWAELKKEAKRKRTTPQRRAEIEVEARALFNEMWGIK